MSKNIDSNSERIMDLKLKIIDIKLERDKYLHKSLLSAIIAIITLVITTGTLANAFNEVIKGAVVSSVSFSPILGIVVFILIALGLPILAYFLTNYAVGFFLKTTYKMYTDRISELEGMIKKLNKMNNALILFIIDKISFKAKI